jgi:hypothetical protein
MRTTLKQLYQQHTGDKRSHQRTIAAHFARLDTRRQNFIRAVLAGRSLRQIAEPAGITHASVKSAIDGALERIRKEIAGEPRYNRRGRVHKPQPPRPAPPAPPETPMVQTCYLLKKGRKSGRRK